MCVKAHAMDFLGRFREIVSDPINLLIKRHPLAGMVDGGFVYLHNGNKVPVSGPYAYYDDFSNILVINRGVHEPLEEYVFQELLKVIPKEAHMLELGAYWGHYSMWLKKLCPESSVHLVEPDESRIQAGYYNFQQNGYLGDFIQEFVGKGQFEVDKYLTGRKIPKIDILHADIQGYEAEMLDGCSEALQEKSINYLFISTHSSELHVDISNKLNSFGYRIEVSSDFDTATTSFDGLIFASNPLFPPLFRDFQPLGRAQIIESQPFELLNNLMMLLQSGNFG